MATLTVGPGQQFSTIAAAVAASRDGDVVQVQAGTYTNDFVTVTEKITLQGVGGMVHMRATTPPPNGKAIMVTTTDVTVDHFEFSGAKVPDRNGAGIRYEGGNLTITNSHFHHNENGLLGNPAANGKITIRNSEFDNNGAGDGYSHNLYVNDIASLTIADSYFHDAVVGHEIKSRAQSTTVTNSRIYDNGGTASYSVDLPNGGKAVLSGNVIEQGPNSDNPAIVAFGAEDDLHAGSSLQLTGNTVVNNLHSSSAKLVVNHTSATATVEGTEVYGLTSDQITSGPATVTRTSYLDTRPALDTSAPWDETGLPSSSDLALTGTARMDALAGGLGNDTLIGRGGNDRLTGGAGDDSLRGGIGEDMLFGGAGHDTLRGGDGADLLNGGAGNDLLVGGNGNDIFAFAGGFGSDTVRDFDASPAGGQDLLDLSVLGITAGDFAAQVSVTQAGAGALVTVDDGSVLLAGVSAGSISASDFILA